MKRLCVFYRGASNWIGKPVEWVVCKECQRKLQKGKVLATGFRAAAIRQRRWEATFNND